MWKRSALSLAVISVCFGAQAQQSNADNEYMEEVLVTGQRAMVKSAIAKQRAADGVVSAITNDTIGSMVDQNVAEAVRRLAGVNVLNDQGEGRFISVRGLDPELNAASINGVRLPAPESDTRAVALDVIPSELVESIEVYKTLTPDMDADTIGASIQINTIKATDNVDFVKVQAALSYNDLNEELSPEYGIDFSRKLSDSLGIAGGVKYSERETSTDNMEMDGWTVSDDGIVYAEDVEYRDYDVLRERLGVSLSVDFIASENTNLFARTLYSKFEDTEQRRRLVFGMNDLQPISGSATGASFVAGADADDDERIEVRRGLKDRYEAQTISTFEFGGETKLKDWAFDYSMSWAKADEKEYNTQDPTRFRERFEDGELGVSFDYSSLEFTPYMITQGADAFFAAETYKLNKIENVEGVAEDDEMTLQFNASHFMNVGRGELEVKGGAKLRQREKTFDGGITVWEDPTTEYTLADVIGVPSYSLIDIAPMPDLNAVRARNANTTFETIELDFVESTLEDFSVEEDVTAIYGMARYIDQQMTLVGGVRYEQTDNKMAGNIVDVDAETAIAQRFSNDYSHVLPSASLKYNLNDDMVLRGGIFKSIVRPKMSKLAPKFEINEDLEAVFGNPELEPYEAWNFDLALEYYFAEGAVVQGGFFYKDIKNFIIDTVYEEDDGPYFGSFNGVSFVEAEVPINGDDANVQGFEFAYNQVFGSGLILGFNYTYTDSEGDIEGRTIALPASSESTYNANIGYEAGAFSARLTLAYRDDYLDELGGDAEEDRWVQEHTQVDFSAEYEVVRDIEVFLKLVNLTDEPYVAYQNGPSQPRLLQYEEYSFTAKFGIKGTF